MRAFDLIVIGAGSGLDVAIGAANRGWKVALVEEGPLGGTCLNRGCIPSKIILHSADVKEEVEKAHSFGIETKIQRINFKRLIERATRLVDADARDIERNVKLERNPVLFKGKTQFVGERELKVNGKVIAGKRIVIAAGTRTMIPPIEGLDKIDYLTSTEALRLTKLPKSLIIVGGGYIGVELGYFYANMGCKVTILQRNKLLIPNSDKEIATAFTALWKKKYNLLTEATAESIKRDKKDVVVTVDINGRMKKVRGEKILIATGRKPNTDHLDLKKTGVKINEKGFVMVNEYLETSAKNVWALGDIAGVYQFKHSANLEAEYVLENIFDRKRKVDYYPMPYAIFTHPQIAGVGITEEEAMQQERKYMVGKYEYKDTGMGTALAENEGFVKFIVDAKNKEILGCHIMGPQASVLIHEVVVAMKADRFKALDILKTAVHVHPALSEVVQRAALNVDV